MWPAKVVKKTKTIVEKIEHNSMSIFNFFKNLLVNSIPIEFIDQYREEIIRIDIKSARTVSGTVAALIVAFSFTGIDYLFMPEHALRFLILRIIIAILCMGAFGLTYHSKLNKHSKFLSYTSLVLGGWAVALMVRILGYDSSYYAGLNLVYLGSILVPWEMKWSLFACLTVYGAYFPHILKLPLV